MNTIDEGAAGGSENRAYRNRMRAQLGFYQHLVILLAYLDEDARSLRIGEDTFSMAGWLRGPVQRRDMPSIRPT